MSLNDFNRSSKLMLAIVGLSLVVLLTSAFDAGCPNECDDSDTKQDTYPLFWVSCDSNNMPVLMHYLGNSPFQVSVPPANFSPSDYDCSNPNSPRYKKSSRPIYTPSSPSGPLPSAPLGPGDRPVIDDRSRAAGANPLVAYLPPLLRDLPFVPNIPPNPSPACDPSFPDVIQTDHTLSQVTRFGTCPFQVKAIIPVVSRPLQVDITPDGSTAIVTSFDNAVNFIDLSTNKVVFTLMTDPAVNPNGLAITPDGKKAYITSFNAFDPVIQVIDLTSHTITATFTSTLQYPQGATLSPDGSQLWITGPLDALMEVYDTATNSLITRLNLGATTDVAFNSTGTRAYVTSQTTQPGVVAMIDTATLQILKSYQVGNGPTDIAMSYADRFLVVNNDLDGSVTVIDLVANKVSTTKIGSSVSGISFVH